VVESLRAENWLMTNALPRWRRCRYLHHLHTINYYFITITRTTISLLQSWLIYAIFLQTFYLTVFNGLLWNFEFNTCRTTVTRALNVKLFMQTVLFQIHRLYHHYYHCVWH